MSPLPRFTYAPNQYDMPVKNAFTYSLCAATLLFLPMWVQHIAAADGGLMAVGGGRLSEEDIFGKMNKKGVMVGGYPKIVFHCLAMLGVTAIAFSVLCILAAHYGNTQQRQAVAGVYLAFSFGAAVVQYTHPWNKDPFSLLEMPMPLLLGVVAIVGTGLALEA
jgi:hypothetical protein